VPRPAPVVCRWGALCMLPLAFPLLAGPCPGVGAPRLGHALAKPALPPARRLPFSALDPGGVTQPRPCEVRPIVWDATQARLGLLRGARYTKACCCVLREPRRPRRAEGAAGLRTDSVSA
jgi:hypothetical protein